MYQIGDYVVKSNAGVCQIEEILYLDNINTSKNKLYYLLLPVSDKKAKIYVPTDSASGIPRKALSYEEAWGLISKIPEIQAINIDNEKQREQKYKEALTSCDPEKWVSIIKAMYQRRQRRNAAGKKSTAMDEHYFKNAENFLYSELAFAIRKNRNEMSQLIHDTINKKDINALRH